MKFKTVVSSNNSKAKKIIITIVVLLILAFAAYVVLGYNDQLTVQQYTVQTNKLDARIRIALITDLHSCKYGEKQQELIEAIDAQSPDLVAFSGDIFDDDIPDDNTEYLLQGITKKYPCYYVTGNHEFWSGAENFTTKMAILNKYDVTVLSGETEVIAANGGIINICGVDDPAQSENDDMGPFISQLESAEGSARSEYYTVLLSHRPELLELYAEHDFDLVLCGHAHGGQWRIPGILNGLLAPNQGLFPKYAGGEYQSGDTTMIVSRGLARETTAVPRLFNPPELVIVDLI